MDYEKKCIEAALACVVACETCATECLLEEDVKKLTLCILLTRECAAICSATARIMAIGADHYQLLCSACEELCSACAEECGKHAHIKHCKECAAACRHCADMCRNMVEDETV